MKIVGTPNGVLDKSSVTISAMVDSQGNLIVPLTSGTATGMFLPLSGGVMAGTITAGVSAVPIISGNTVQISAQSNLILDSNNQTQFNGVNAVQMTSTAGNVSMFAPSGTIQASAGDALLLISNNDIVNIISASGIVTFGDITPTVSGTDNLGSSIKPFDGGYLNELNLQNWKISVVDGQLTINTI